MFSPEEQVAKPANMSRTSKSFQELKLGCQKTKQESKQKKDRAEIQLGLIDLTSLNLFCFNERLPCPITTTDTDVPFNQGYYCTSTKLQVWYFFFEKQVW